MNTSNNANHCAIKPLPSQKYLKECFSYDPNTGLLIWKVRPLEHFKNKRIFNVWNAKYSNKVAGYIENSGHLAVCISNHEYRIHRLIWKIQSGLDPVALIDHIDRNKLNNKWENLREATKSQNNKNASFKNSSGFIGVYFDNRSKKYQAAIRINGKNKSLGYFNTAEEAFKVRSIAEKATHGEFANNGVQS